VTDSEHHEILAVILRLRALHQRYNMGALSDLADRLEALLDAA
jgi:hypothetical protein